MQRGGRGWRAGPAEVVRGVQSGDLLTLQVEGTAASTAPSETSTVVGGDRPPHSSTPTPLWLHTVGERGCAVLSSAAAHPTFGETCRPVQVGLVDRLWQILSQEHLLQGGGEQGLLLAQAGTATPCFLTYGEVCVLILMGRGCMCGVGYSFTTTTAHLHTHTHSTCTSGMGTADFWP